VDWFGRDLQRFTAPHIFSTHLDFFFSHRVVGSGFDLANNSPRYGFGITFSIATIGLALSVGLFYASVLKAKAETEADDKEYMKGR
jgi:hypothetical protein